MKPPPKIRRVLSINTLSPHMKIHILLTVLPSFLVELVRRIYLNTGITASHPW